MSKRSDRMSDTVALSTGYVAMMIVMDVQRKGDESLFREVTVLTDAEGNYKNCITAVTHAGNQILITIDDAESLMGLEQN